MVQELHHLDDAHRVVGFHSLADLDERRTPGLPRTPEQPNRGARHLMEGLGFVRGVSCNAEKDCRGAKVGSDVWPRRHPDSRSTSIVEVHGRYGSQASGRWLFDNRV